MVCLAAAQAEQPIPAGRQADAAAQKEAISVNPSGNDAERKPEAAAPAGEDPPRDIKPTAAPEAAAAADANVAKPPAEPGLVDEIEKLRQLQNELRALLEASGTLKPRVEHPDGTKDAATPPAGGQAPPGEPVDTLAAADALYLSGRYDDALALYGKGGAANKEDAAWQGFQKANCLRWLGRLEEAIAACQRVITEYPDSFWAKPAQDCIQSIQWKMEFPRR